VTSTTDRAPVAVVTGASAGVGRAVAVALGREGFDVALLARGQGGVQAAAAEVGATGVRSLPVLVDVADFDGLQEAADRVERDLGPIGLWVNNAMTTVFAPAWEVAPADFRRAVEVTFLGQVWGTRVALDRMRPRDGGTIVNVGSALAYIGIPLQSAYCAAKFACRGYFESVRAELVHERSGVRLCMVHLPAVNTPQFDWCETTLDRRPQPVPPIYQPEVAARFIVRSALSGRRSKVVGSWNTLLVAAGSVLPGLGNQFAGLSAWDSQLGDDPVDPDRAVNLCRPVDAAHDRGAHGAFDGRSGGFFDPHFLRTLPATAVNFGRAIGRATREKRRLRPRPLRS